MKKIETFFLLILITSNLFALSASDYFENGKEAFQKENYSLAIDFFKRALASKPEVELREKTIYYLSLSLHYNGDYKASIKNFLDLLNEFPQTLYKEKALFVIALNYYRLKDYENAIFRLRKYLSSYPEGKWVKEARFTIAYSLMFINQYPQAAEEWEKYIKDYSVTDEALLRLGQSYFYGERYDKAKETFEEFVRRYKDSKLYPEALTFLGKSYYFLQNYAKAIAIFEELNVDSSFLYYEDVIYFSAMSYLQNENYEKAIGFLSLITNSKDYSDEVNYKLGIIYKSRKNFEDSLQCFKRISPNSQYFRRAGLEIANVYMEMENYDKALSILNDFIKISDENLPYAYQKIGEIHLALSNYSKAVENFSIIIKNYPKASNFKDALFLRGRAFYLKENYKEATADLKNFLNISENEEEKENAILILGEIAIKNSDYNLAINYYKELLTFKNKRIRVQGYNLIAWAYFRQNNYEKAKETYLSIIDLFPESEYTALSYYNLGIINYNQKNYKEAISYFEKVYKDFKESEYFEDAVLKVGWIYYKEEKFKLLIDYLEKFSGRINKKVWEYESLKGWANFRLGNFKQAVKNFEGSLLKANDIKETNESLIAIAKSYYNMNEFSEAFKYYYQGYNNAINYNLRSEIPSLLSDMAWSLVKSGNLDEAKRYYQELVDKYPDSEYTSEALFKLGEYYYSISDFKKSMEYYNKIIELNRDTNFVSLAIYWSGWCYWNINDKLNAIKTFEKYVELFPDGEYAPDVLLRIGTIYHEWNNIKLARESLERLIKKYPSSYEAEKASVLMEEINLLSESSGDKEKFYKLLLKKSKTPEAKANIMLKLANYYKERNRKEEALDLYRKIVEMTAKEDAAIATVELGFDDMEKGDYKKAIERFSSIFYVYKYSFLYPQALYGIAVSYYMLGKADIATKYLERLIEKYPSSEWTTKAREVIK